MAELANVVRGPRPRQGPPGFPNSQERLPEPSPRDQNFPGRPRPERPYPDMQRGEGDFPGRPNLGPQEFHLPPRLANLFEDTEKGEFYFRIWRRDQQELSKSTNAPLIGLAEIKPGRPGLQQPVLRGRNRETVLLTPGGETLLVGKNVSVEIDELQRSGIWLAGVGGGVLLLGLAGGWWNASRVIKPIDEIGAAAVRIAEGDLSQRINTSHKESELGRLATVLNSTFARLESAFSEQKHFTADAAHELRTPVAVLLTQTQSALTRERSAPEYREALEACQRAAQRMKRLLESLLELARLDAGQESFSWATVDLAKIASECAEQVRPLAEQAKIELTSTLEPAECRADAGRIAQVITNLLMNAIAYNQPNGRVALATKKQDGFAVLEVADTGVGIDQLDLPHVFERFYRADKSRSTGGAGLGLSISKAIVEAHGGIISVTSERNKGSTFTLRLPG